MKRVSEFLLRLTPKEKQEFDDLFERLENECDISHQRRSELIFEGFKQYAEQLLASYIPNHTHTKSQSLTSQRREAIFSKLEDIKERGYVFMMQAYAELILSNDCYTDVKMRSRASYFQTLLQSEDLFFMNLPYYHDTLSRYPIVIIHRQSKWWPQLKDLCFNIREPVFKLTHDQISDAKLRDQIFMRLQRKAHYKSKLDRAEKTMLNIFLHEIGVLEEKPIYDNTDLTMQEVIRLRSELRFEEARDLLEQEKQRNVVAKSTQLTAEEMEVFER